MEMVLTKLVPFLTIKGGADLLRRNVCVVNLHTYVRGGRLKVVSVPVFGKNFATMAYYYPQQDLSENKDRFNTVQLFSDKILGIGSYGKVCIAQCDDLLCAAKILHPTLLDPTADKDELHVNKHRMPIRRFIKECQLLSTIRHPNIVQCLGVYQDPGSNLPVLLMELMDNNLTRYLENSPHPIPYHVQVNICHDISLALSYLHSNKIIHRDLSGNNVLLIGNIRAKVTDFGMAQLGYQKSHCRSFTMCPGTDVYMPPEAVREEPVYTNKIDCFSFGVIAIQILTQLFPKPENRHKEVHIHYPRLPRGITMVLVPEVDRRHNHISKVNPNNPLLQIALDCLKDKDVERPTAHQLCGRIVSLKDSSEYQESSDETTHQIQRLQLTIKSQTRCLEDKVQTITAMQEEIEKLREHVKTKDKLIEERERQLQHQINATEPVVAKYERTIWEQKQLLRREPQQHSPIRASSNIKHKVTRSSELSPEGVCNTETEKEPMNFVWREGPSAVRAMIRGSSDSIVIGNTMYLRPGATEEIHAFNICTRTWLRVPDCRKTNCSITAVNNLLTTVGGWKRGKKCSNKLYCLTGEEGNERKWTKKFPPMPTRRSRSTTLCSRNFLIVAGGEGRFILRTVEVMDTETYQWSTAADLPEPRWCGLAAICGDSVYFLGGVDENEDKTKVGFRCSLNSLLQTCSRTTSTSRMSGVLRSLSTSSDQSLSIPSGQKAMVAYHGENIWSTIADIPVSRSSCVSFNNRLMAVGGWAQSKATSFVYVYDSKTDSWNVISHMLKARYSCFTAVFHDNQLVVVGGMTDSGTTNTVEFAAV